jgi:hypothetical protein
MADKALASFMRIIVEIGESEKLHQLGTDPVGSATALITLNL